MVDVFLTGATGYLGSRLAPLLADRGHLVTALVRARSLHRLPGGCIPLPGDALELESYRGHVAPADTLVHLVGVASPGPGKAAAFEQVDLRSTVLALAAARQAGVRHFVYVSVAQPLPLMRAYQAARGRAEAAIRSSGLDATILRPWYVLGPGHRWPALLLPAYWLAERLPASRDAARRARLVTLDQMLAALVRAVEQPPRGIRVVDVEGIRTCAQGSAQVPVAV